MRLKEVWIRAKARTLEAIVIHRADARCCHGNPEGTVIHRASPAGLPKSLFVVAARTKVRAAGHKKMT